MKKYYINEIDFIYPESYKKIVELGMTNFDIWFLMDSEQAASIYNGMKKRYPNRNLIPFAKRADNDDTACFEIGKEETVQIIHDFASESYEQRNEFNDLWDWLLNVVKEMVDYNKKEKTEI